MKNFVVAALLMLACFVCQAQTVFSGRIIDGNTGEELIGASVLEKGTTFGTIDSEDG